MSRVRRTLGNWRWWVALLPILLIGLMVTIDAVVRHVLNPMTEFAHGALLDIRIWVYRE